MVRQPASQRAVAQNEINKDNMKIIRNIARRPWPRIGGWLPVVMLICGVLASCSSEDESTTPLPDGKYPLQLTAEVAQPHTRAAGKDAWTGGEEIRVSLEGVFGNKTYVMDASGNASPKDADNAFYWKNTDDTLHVTAPMRQYVRRLDIELTATEGDYSRVQSATATLSGVASAADMATGDRSAAAQVTNAFRQDGNKFTIFFRLLGIVPTETHTLTVDITFNNGDTQRVVSDLTEAIRDFNNGTKPVKLTGNLLLPVEAGVTGATITGWNEVESGNGDAN